MIHWKVTGTDELPFTVTPGDEVTIQVTDVDPLDDGDVEVTCRVVDIYG